MNLSPGVRIGIDTGGTFTDCIASTGELVKVPSTPDAPERAIRAALDALAVAPATLAHGTTVATNTVLQRSGARVALVATAGFKDVIEIRRQNRPDIYNLRARWPDPLVSREFRFEAPERITFDGSVLASLADEEAAKVAAAIVESGAEAVAIALLFSFVNPAHEQRLARALARANEDLHVSLSSHILPEAGEYERTSATTLNAYVAPVMEAYLSRLAAQVAMTGNPDLYVMNSNGGLVDLRLVRDRPLLTMLSGPAAGVVGATAVAASCGMTDIVTMDIGGTSTDVSIVPGRVLDTPHASVANLPLGISMLDIETIGAGGGSIARVDEAGLLHVGPGSSGSVPGPACYGNSDYFTVTDANLVLGRIPCSLLGGNVTLDKDAALRAADSVGGRLGMTAIEAAMAVVRIACSNIERAIRRVSVERGYDPRRFALMAYGGAGPQHAAEVAQGMSMTTVLIPAAPGVMAAYGLLVAPRRRDYSLGVLLPADLSPRELDAAFVPLHESAVSELGETAPDTTETFVDVRYQGQAFPLRVAVSDDVIRDFHAAHLLKYGYNRPERAVEIVTLRLRVTSVQDELIFPFSRLFGGWSPSTPDIRPVVFATGDAQFGFFETPVYNRHRCGVGSEVIGPAILEQYDSTVVVPPGWTAVGLEDFNTLLVRR